MKKLYVCALIALSTFSFGQTTKTLMAVDGTQKWVAGTWTNGLPASTANNTDITAISVTSSNVDAIYYQKKVNNLTTTTFDQSLLGSGTVVIDVNSAVYFNGGAAFGIVHQSTIGKRFTIDCNVQITNSTAPTGANAYTALRCQGNAGNVLEFGPNSVIESIGNGGATAVHALLGTIELNGKIKGTKNLLIAGGSVIFGATSNNSDFTLSTNSIQLFNGAELVVNTQNGNTFFKNTAGGIILVAGGSASIRINTVNVWDSILSVGTTSADGLTGANLILNGDQTANTGAIAMTAATAVLNLTVASGKNVTFGNSSANTWTPGAAMNITGFDNSTITFGADNTALTMDQLSMIHILDGAHIGETVGLNAQGKLVVTSTLRVAKSKSFEFSVYPNPVKDVVRIQTAETVSNAKVMDITGKILLSQSHTKEINLSSLSRGVYLMQITTERGGATSKIVKE
ncbi:MAG: hypothetical protein ACI93P_000316 [bacterium]|jgi:hypothetical protein